MGVSGRKNVIVLGAGASKEFSLPTGEELKTRISKIADIRYGEWGRRLETGDPMVVGALSSIADERGMNGITDLLVAGWKIKESMALAPSIDNFLDTHKHDENIVSFGKIGNCECNF